MSTLPPRGHQAAPDRTGAGGPGPALAAAVTDLTEQVETLSTAAANDAVERSVLLDRADHLAVQTEDLLDRISALETLTPAAAAGGPPSYPYIYPTVGDWVDEVFTRLAAAYRVKWCTAWEDHLEARARLDLLWHTWESAHAAAPGAAPNWAAVDEWTRVIFDHHTPKLLDVDGPFAGCVPGERCTPPARLAQRDLATHTAAPIRLDSYHRRTRPTRSTAGVR